MLNLSILLEFYQQYLLNYKNKIPSLGFILLILNHIVIYVICAVYWAIAKKTLILEIKSRNVRSN